MNEYIKLYLERKKRNKKEVELAKKKLDSLSIVDKNAYEQIIDRHEVNTFSIVLIPFKFMLYAGLFFIVTSIIGGVDISMFREAFFYICRMMLLLSVFFIFLASLVTIFSSIELNKLRLKLLR